MHGRLKVRTTQEQEERKRLEREKKLKAYKYAMSECLSRIQKKQYDQVGLKISEEVLSSNPDIQTLWNLRKNIIETFETSLNDDEMQTIFVTEMSLTEICLKKNPKSYGTWYHRQWCLLRSNSNIKDELVQKSNWKNELNLCSLFLNLDERNFHCWRHRFFVVKHGNLSKKDELEFTFEKISSNFSNYSSWHYRSKLIEELYYQNQINNEIFEKELNLIENAIFTDPNDQSAWIYQKWFLFEHQRSFIKELILNCESKCISFKFAKELDLNQSLKFLKINDCVITFNEDFKWSVEGNETKGDFNQLSDKFGLNILIDNLVKSKQGKIKIEIMLQNCGFSAEILLDLNQETRIYEFKSKFQMKDLRLDSEILDKHFKSILELNQFEQENSKWCLLKSIELMCLIDYERYKDTIFKYLDKLSNEIDLYRKNYYIDLKKKLIENNS